MPIMSCGARRDHDNLQLLGAETERFGPQHTTGLARPFGEIR
jgi:hypothetical protein